MKKTVLISWLIIVITYSYSQTEQGNKFIGGAIGLSGFNRTYTDTSEQYTNKSFAYQITPSFGYFIKNNLAMGANLNYSENNSEQTFLPTNPKVFQLYHKSKTINYGVSAYARYYKKVVNNLFFSVNAGAIYSYQTQNLEWSTTEPNYVYPKTNPQNQEIITNIYGINIVPALEYYITPKLGIRTNFSNFYLDYGTTKNISLGNNSHANNYSYGVNLSLSTFTLGLYYYF